MVKVKCIFTFILLLVLGGFGISHADLCDGLVAFYPFNGNANDESGNGNNGTVYGATLTTDRFGNSNSAYLFNGVNSYIEVPDSVSLTLTPDFSISLWLTNYSNAERGRLLTKGPDNNKDFHLFWETRPYDFCPPNTIDANISNDSVCSNVVALNTLYNITYVAIGGKSLSIYVNGALQATNNITAIPNNTSEPLLIGAYPGPIQVFNGIIDDIRIYNRALSVDEIQGLWMETDQYALIVSKSGAGTGRVTSLPTGIDCDTSCTNQSADFELGIQVTLHATADIGSTFTGWSGPCTGTGDCVVIMCDVVNVTAEFLKQPFAHVPAISNLGMIVLAVLTVGSAVAILRRRKSV